MTPSRHRVTIKDIAAELGLDYSSVGYALRGKGTLSEETRKRIQAAADRMGYIRNHAASQMRARRSMTIGVIVPNLVLGYNEFVEHLLAQARQRGYRLQIGVSEFDGELEDDAVRTMFAAGVDGLILRSLHREWQSVPARAVLRTLQRRGVPVVVHGTALQGSGFSRVVPQPEAGIRELAMHLARQGFRRPAFLTPFPSSQIPSYAATLAELRTMLSAAGIAPEFPVVPNDEPATEATGASGTPHTYHRHVDDILAHAGILTGRRLLRKALDLPVPPDVLLCQNEMTAIGALMEAQRLGIDIPRGLGLCATTRNMLLALAPIPLTHLDVPYCDMAKAALDLLLDDIGHDRSTGTVRTVARRLTLGRSTLRHAETP